MPIEPVFISYSHENRASADRLRKDLEAHNVPVWIDHEKLVAGTPDWGRAIESGVPRCQALIYVASPAAKRSRFVIHELAVAERFSIPVYPFWIEGAEWLDVAPFGWARTQYIDARPGYMSAFKELLGLLRPNLTPGQPTLPQSESTAATIVNNPTTRPETPLMTSGEKLPSPKAPSKPLRKEKVDRSVLTRLRPIAIALIVILIVSGSSFVILSHYQGRSSTPGTATNHAIPTHTPAKPVGDWTVVSSLDPEGISDPRGVSSLSSIAGLAANDIWVVGPTTMSAKALVEHWDGSSWKTAASPDVTITSGNDIGDELVSITALTPNNIWAVGNTAVSDTNSSDQGTDYSIPLIEHWDGASWSVVPGSKVTDGALWSIAALTSDNVWAVGTSHTGNPAYDHTLIEHWNGSSWATVPSPSPNPDPTFGNGLAGISILASNDIWAVGTADTRALVEHWEGSSWTVVPSPNPGTYDNGLQSVTTLAPDNIWAVGSYRNSANDSSHTLVEHWDGKSWSVIASVNAGSGNNGLSGITAVAPNDIWAVGETSLKTLVEHWNGSSWAIVASPNPSPTYNSLYAITALAPNVLWAVGRNGNDTLTERWMSST